MGSEFLRDIFLRCAVAVDEPLILVSQRIAIGTLWTAEEDFALWWLDMVEVYTDWAD